uniref:Oligosaccharyltransferase complex subunit n=2 Tax=Hucho hucho TaxID=62062 RepID=A0A4W5JS36_9TELE
METLYGLPFAVLECPNIKLKKPSWLHMPSAMTVYAIVIVSYFLITGGIIYDVIVEPPSVGSMTDEHGHQRPVAFLAYRVNGQYIMEGLASSFLFTMGGLGFIILDRSNAPNIPKLNRFLLLFIGFVSVLLSFFMARVFMRMKLPSLQWVPHGLKMDTTYSQDEERKSKTSITCTFTDYVLTLQLI